MSRFLRSVTKRASREDPERLGAVLDRFWSQICLEAHEALKLVPETDGTALYPQDRQQEEASSSRKRPPKG